MGDTELRRGGRVRKFIARLCAAAIARGGVESARRGPRERAVFVYRGNVTLSRRLSNLSEGRAAPHARSPAILSICAQASCVRLQHTHICIRELQSGACIHYVCAAHVYIRHARRDIITGVCPRARTLKSRMFNRFTFHFNGRRRRYGYGCV